MKNELLLRNIRPMAGQAGDVLIRDGLIASIAQPSDTPRHETNTGIKTIDGNNAILIPGLVEAHTHLDKTLLGTAWYRNEVGPRLIDRIENERRVKKQLQLDVQRVRELPGGKACPAEVDDLDGVRRDVRVVGEVPAPPDDHHTVVVSALVVVT